ncbi:probetacellulin [Athene cunicularia]|uniref:probetacellulin n=1 Tax=Athene cunicularia TaxID=194338 RepID=UPI000EF66625|nr:probetacellulin [Athene cunicularia]
MPAIRLLLCDVPQLSRPSALSRGHGEHGHPFPSSVHARHPMLWCSTRARRAAAVGRWRCQGSGRAPPLSCLCCVSGLAFVSCVGADANVTTGHSTEGLTCSTAESCMGNVTQLRRHGHFSRCPEEYKHYCVKGRCRFLVAEKAPACVCERGYTGARCERVDIFYLRGDRGQIVIISLIAAIVTLIVLVVCACLCSHHCRKQRRKRKAEEMETLNKNLPSKSEDVLETGIV